MTMIRTTAPLAVLVLALLLPAQRKAPVVWHADFDKAMSLAKRTNKDLFVDFTGSDWCQWCVKLHDEVLSRPDFANKAARRFVLVALDFPMDEDLKRQVPNPERNKALAAEYRITGYPTVLLLDRGGSVLARTGYRQGGASAYLQYIEELHAAGRKRVEEAAGLQRRMKRAKPEERESVVREALGLLKSTELGGPGWQVLCGIAEDAFAIDPGDDRGLLEATLATLVDTRKASPGVLDRLRANDPQNEKKRLERIARAMLARETFNPREAIEISDELDRLTAAGVELDRDLAFRMNYLGAVGIDQLGEDLPRAKRYAKVAMDIGPDPEAKTKLQAILDKR